MSFRIDSFKLLALGYILAGCFTHFAFLPDSIDDSARRHGMIIALREFFFLLLFLSAVLHFITRSLSGRVGYQGSNLVLFSLIFLYPSLLVLELSTRGSMSELIVAARVMIATLATIILPIELAGRADRVDFIRNVVVALLLVQVVVAFFQMLWMPPFDGATFMGSRAVGTFVSPLHLSLFSGAVAVLVAVRETRYRVFILACCTFVCVVSGGRAGMLVLVVALLYRFAANIRGDLSNRLLFLLCSALLIMAAYVFVSTPELSGRSGTSSGLAEEARWTTWYVVLARNFADATIWEWLTGVGIGTGSNTAATVARTNVDISDSTFIFMLQSYGLIGFILIAVAASAFWRGLTGLHVAAIVGWVVAANTQTLFELHPMNFVLLCALSPAATAFRILRPMAAADYGTGQRTMTER